MTEKELKNMKLHEKYQSRDKRMEVMRVVNGWGYRMGNVGFFVPETISKQFEVWKKHEEAPESED